MSGAVRCDAAAARDGEEPDGVRRLFSTPAEETYVVGGSVLPAGGGKNPVTLPGVTVSSTSQLGGDPAAGGLAAVDGDAGTTWRPDVTDLRPALTLGWSSPKRISGLHIEVSPASGARAPRQVQLAGRSETRTVQLDAGGSASFEPLETDQLQIVLPGDDDDPTARAVVGIGSLTLSGGPDLLPGPDPTFTVPCGSGPNVHLDGLDYRTSVQGTLSDITAHRPLELRMCRDSEGGVALPAGGHELRTDRSESFVVQDLWLRPVHAAATPPVHRAVQVGEWAATARSVTVAPGAEAVLAVPENANAGWVATLDGKQLTRTRVDGWQQAWIVPAGPGGVVSLTFTPDAHYRLSLLIGAIAVLVLLVGVVWPVRRRRRFTVSPGGSWTPVVLIGLLVALGGMLPVVLLIACLLARQFSERAPRYAAFGGMVLAAGVSVTGRILGHGQEWAYGPVTQAALLLAAAALAATCVDWFTRTRNPTDPTP
ncbi:coagulation factor 5/8 type [Amycolatopsis vancoresmycina DSM 44592]|uniref:Coagulation factor 5/8 type n=1 Tax=Amycolatopsis vancoresmycina DSM 44592 TaxID=1292037 RepID=R1HUP4_9PSEU|nr:coagulation factor 5/8 type [Amycolatopsis vancoresmycina DSM 44592]